MSIMKSSYEYIPKVTKSLVRTPEPDYSKVKSFHFEGSDTLICVFNKFLHISFNNGESWKPVDIFKEELICFVDIDPFHKGRAFVTSESGKIHVTEDAGTTWKELHIPKPPGRSPRWVRTHPNDRKLLLLGICITAVRLVVYASDDAGQNFRQIIAPSVNINHHKTTPTRENYKCYFAVSSKESTLENNGIYYLHKAIYTEGPSGGAILSTEGYDVYSLFYTDDFGKTAKGFDELSGYSVEDIFIFSSCVFVITAEGKSRENKKLWVSKGGSFEPVHLPDEVICLEYGQYFPGDERKQLSLTVKENDNDDYISVILDPSNLNFSRGPAPSSKDVSEYFMNGRHVRETSKGRLYSSESPEDWDCRGTDFTHFDGTNTCMFILDGFLHISFNGGESWQAVDAFREGKACYVNVDPFHKGRAFVTSKGWNFHVTEDQGRSWKELRIPKVRGEDKLNPPHIRSHPIDRKLLLLEIGIDAEYWSPRRNMTFSFKTIISFISDDAGKSFRRIVAPVRSYRYPDVAPINECYNCHFAVSSKESTLENNGVYYLHCAKYAKDIESGESDDKNNLFYTSDFGKTTKTFDELNGLSVENIFVFPSGVFVLTSEGNEENQKLWISKGGAFKPVSLPDEVVSLEEAYLLPLIHGYDKTQLFLNVGVRESDIPFRMLVLNTLNLKFSFRSLAPCACGACFGQVGNLKGTFWESNPWEEPNVSFDAGRSWRDLTGLRVIDPSGKHKHLFEGGTEDMENCSFDGSLCFSSDEPTAGILMDRGTLVINGERKSEDDMTFISRDGGDSWEVAFEFPVRAAFLDFGNIIVAIPAEKSNVYTRFLFSLDQGRTWNEHPFEEPIHESCEIPFSIHSFGLKALIESKREEEGPPEYVFYSLDFSNIFGGAACTEGDLERWYLYDGKCIDGVRYSFDRRKADAKCLVRKTFRDLELHEERCES